MSKVNKARKSEKIWDYDYVERYVTDNFFSYSRGDMTVMLTNSSDKQSIKMPYTPYNVGDEICNIFWPEDCQVVTSTGIQASLENGEAKIFVKKDSAYWSDNDFLEGAYFVQA